MKNNNKHQPHLLSEIQFYFRPLSAQFKSESLNKKFRLYLQRQVQIIGKVNTLLLKQKMKENFTFPSDQQNINFRVLRAPSSVYQLALYQVTTFDEETFLAVAQLSLCNYVKDYYKQLLKCEEQLWSQLRNDQKASIPQIWRTLSNNFTKKLLTSVIEFNKTAIQVKINVIAVNKYDKQVKIDDQIQKKKKYEKVNCKKKAEFGRSKTAPSFPEIILPQLIEKHVESQVVLAKLKSLQPDINRTENNHITQLQIPSLNFRLNKIQQVQELENQIQEKPKTKKSIKQKKQFFSFDNNFNISSTNQQPNQQPQFQRSNEKRLETEASQFQAVNTTQGMKPDIGIKAFRSIPVQEINRKFQTFTQLNIQSTFSLAKADSKNLLMCFSLICFMILIYWLMHPLSKL